MVNTSTDIARICDKVKNLLISKNLAYGDSALNPVRVMSKSGPIEQILVRIDDKLSRITRGDVLTDDEDVIMDLIGYFIILKIALERDAQDAYNETLPTDS